MAPGSLLQPLRKTRWKPTQRAIAVLIAQESHGSSPCARQELFLQLLKSEGLILTNPQLGCWSPGASSPLGDREATGNLPRHRAQLPPQTPRHESKCKQQTSPAQPHEGLRTNPPGSPPKAPTCPLLPGTAPGPGGAGLDARGAPLAVRVAHRAALALHRCRAEDATALHGAAEGAPGGSRGGELPAARSHPRGCGIPALAAGSAGANGSGRERSGLPGAPSGSGGTLPARLPGGC